MRVFVLCTGRCGSTTFIRACGHMTNFTSGHETRARIIGPDRLDYPDNHIEADNRLTWMLGRLDEEHGYHALYVHLTRDPEAVTQSFHQRWEHDVSLALAYHRAVLMQGARPPTIETVRDMIHTQTANIRAFLHGKDWMPVRVETAAADFDAFWDRTEATGDRDAAVGEWARSHNAGPPAVQRQPVPRRLGRLRKAFGF